VQIQYGISVCLREELLLIAIFLKFHHFLDTTILYYLFSSFLHKLD